MRLPLYLRSDGAEQITSLQVPMTAVAQTCLPFEGPDPVRGKNFLPLESGELIFWRADTGAEVKRLKAEWGWSLVALQLVVFWMGGGDYVWCWFLDVNSQFEFDPLQYTKLKDSSRIDRPKRGKGRCKMFFFQPHERHIWSTNLSYAPANTDSDDDAVSFSHTLCSPQFWKAHDAGISKFDFNEDRELVATVSHVRSWVQKQRKKSCWKFMGEIHHICEDMSVCVWDIGKGPFVGGLVRNATHFMPSKTFSMSGNSPISVLLFRTINIIKVVRCSEMKWYEMIWKCLPGVEWKLLFKAQTVWSPVEPNLPFDEFIAAKLHRVEFRIGHSMQWHWDPCLVLRPWAQAP